MTRFRLTVEYDGRPYMGWQRQGHGPSVQQSIEEAILAITQEEAVVHAAGRTDAGVHAEAMSAHVDIARNIDAFRLMEAINAKLRPHPIAILDCAIVADDWHARFSCIGRRYVYRIINRRAPLALDQ
ncbi:MAG: tRNA pseudouridine(38-40) synthase TruA, partial [Alphaproteobacteria bacterium]|nr:tRNA pseudouridine(38-40) synthase TruA [Alphaproteobacteria bacterium]